MKAIEMISYEGKRLSVLVETMPDNDKQAHVSYFIDGIEITDFGKPVKRYQRMLTALADNLCEGLGLIKWSY